MSGFRGMATSTEYLCSELAKLGVNMTVTTTEWRAAFDPAETATRRGVGGESLYRTIRLPVAARAFERFTGMYYTPGFLAAYTRQAASADVVHFHGFRSRQNFAVANTKQRRRRSYIIQPNGSAVLGYGKGNENYL